MTSILIIIALSLSSTAIFIGLTDFIKGDALKAMIEVVVGILFFNLILFGEPISQSIQTQIQAYQVQNRNKTINHLQSEIPNEVSLRKLDSQLKYRGIDLDDADSVSYDNGVLKIFFSDWNLFTGTQSTTWSVKLHDNAIDSTSRSRS
ncbi:hypothetical protein [Fructobacillus americanaquae]|uniref:Uncharacterized protein n=1 Tax=Fructobacillus americanaquae TaxID=2940302 RepID=A0ABY5C0Z8_9LACO|nr:hypothetical protein [Fructobacillus americanaquae]USS92156.1 hypothetical protein M3M36_00635 [Fructobacillus americanaquae]